MSILIPSHCDDVHALAVHHVLKNKDILSLLYIGADYPSQMLSTSTIDDKNDLHYEIEGTNIYYSSISSDIDVVWLRRETNSIIPLSLNKSDRDFMQDVVAH
ncbi:hypothetical protein [Shewanella baltica]|uniref:hypothetical protein n=1 Tax=Shewanella baltica TaxID=62322 RepID=UPI003CFC036A